MAQFNNEVIRIAFDVEDLEAQVDAITGETPEMWRNNDVVFQLGFFYKGQPVDGSGWSEIKLLVKEQENRASAAALMNQVVSSASIDPVFTLEEWEAGAKQHCSISFSAAETRLDLRGVNSREFWLAVIARTAGGKRVTLGCSILNMHHDGEDESSISPPLGSSIVPSGATYNGSGLYVLTGLTANRAYAYTKNGSDTKLVNGSEELAASGNFFAQGTTATLHGTPSALVTATVRYPVFPTLEELDARYQKKDTPWKLSPNGRYLRLSGVTDEGEPFDQVIDLQSV